VLIFPPAWKCPRGRLPEKMPHKDRDAEDDSWTKCHIYLFFLSLLTLTFYLWPHIQMGRHFCTVHLTAKFHNFTLSFGSYHVDKLTNEQTLLKTSTSLRYAMPVGNNLHHESKKGCHPNHGYNFVNSWSICKLLSLLQRAVNFQQNPY